MHACHRHIVIYNYSCIVALLDIFTACAYYDFPRCLTIKAEEQTQCIAGKGDNRTIHNTYYGKSEVSYKQLLIQLINCRYD